LIRQIEHNRPLTKTRWLALAALLAIVPLGVAALWLRPEAEPLYQGQPLHYWLKGYDPAAGPSSSNPAPGPTRDEADDAVRALGTNAIPDLLRMLVYRQSPLISPLLTIGRRLHIVKSQFSNPCVRNWEAQTAFSELGYKAAGAVPELIQLYDTHPDSSSRTSILFVLDSIGPIAKEAVPVLLRAMTDTNEEVRVNAISALCKIQTDPAHVVPALITYLSDPAPIVRRNTILALSQFGAKAKPAVPALLQLLRDEKYDPARSPDPVAATKGRLNQPK
jgi:hypothetical protein